MDLLLVCCQLVSKANIFIDYRFKRYMYTLYPYIILFLYKVCPHLCLSMSAEADTGGVVLSAAVKRALSPEDVVAAVGQLGDNTLAPAGVDMSGLDLDQGGFGGFGGGRWAAVAVLGACKVP